MVVFNGVEVGSHTIVCEEDARITREVFFLESSFLDSEISTLKPFGIDFMDTFPHSRGKVELLIHP